MSLTDQLAGALITGAGALLTGGGVWLRARAVRLEATAKRVEADAVRDLLINQRLDRVENQLVECEAARDTLADAASEMRAEARECVETRAKLDSASEMITRMDARLRRWRAALAPLGVDAEDSDERDGQLIALVARRETPQRVRVVEIDGREPGKEGE